jgi:hypothetical protein
MAVGGIKTTFEQLAKFGAPKMKTDREKLAKFNMDEGLHNYFLSNQVCYDDNSVITGPGGRSKGEYPEASLAIWEVIAAAMVARFYKDRAGKSYPKWKNAKPGVLPKPGTGMPLTGFMPDQTPVLMKPIAPWDSDTTKAIVNWFKFNYDYACEEYNKATNVEGTGKASDKTDPPNKKISDTIEKQFNTFYKGCQFGAGGIPLPAIMLNKMKKKPYPKYMPYCKPHKDAPGNIETTDPVTKKPMRTGALGYLIGPFQSNKQFIEVMAGSEQKTVEIVDNGNKEKVGVYKEDVANLDRNEYLIDDDFYQDKIREELGPAGYKKFRSRVKLVTDDIGPSGMPIDGKQIMLPGPPPKPVRLPAQGTPGTPGYEPAKNLYNLDRNGNGLTKRASAGGLINPGFMKPIDDPAYGAAQFDASIKVKHWKNNGENFIVFKQGSSKTGVWGGLPSGVKFTGTSGNDPVKSYIKYVKENVGTGVKTYSGTDPRSWGPWEEYEGKGTSDTQDPILVKMGLNKLKYKYIIPKGLTKALLALDTPLEHKPGNGLPGLDGDTLPAMNKQYWGLRVMEAFPNAKNIDDAIGKATAPPKKDKAGQAVVVPGAGGVLDKGSSTFVGGPAPPFMVMEKNSPIHKKPAAYKWKWNNAVVLFGKGKLKRQGTPFMRGLPPAVMESKHMGFNLKTITKKIDDHITGEGNGGMTWFDASKQIIPPYAPPPLKPPLPNSKKYKF